MYIPIISCLCDIQLDLNIALFSYHTAITLLLLQLKIDLKKKKKLGMHLSHVFCPVTQIKQLQKHTDCQFSDSANLHPSSFDHSPTAAPSGMKILSRPSYLVTYLYRFGIWVSFLTTALQNNTS